MKLLDLFVQAGLVSDKDLFKKVESSRRSKGERKARRMKQKAKKMTRQRSC